MLICLSESNPPPHPPLLPLGWGCHSDRFIDIWRERRRGAWLKGWGWRGEVERRQRRRGWVPVWGRWRSVFQMCLCVSSVNQPSVAVCARRGSSSWTFTLPDAILAVFHRGRDWFSSIFTPPPPKKKKKERKHDRLRVEAAKCALLNWLANLCPHIAVSCRFVPYAND